MDADVAIVGAGIAGSALGAILAADGLTVVILERQESYQDQVRGEGIWPWGVAEATQLGIHDALLAAAGGSHVEWLVDYMDGADPNESEREPVPLSEMMEGSAGALNIGHPPACQTLAAIAVERGAAVVTGVDGVEISVGERPEVRFVANDRARHIRCRLIIGADGRNSTVRRQAGISLERASASHMVSGLLVEGLDIPPDRDVAGVGDDAFMVTFPQTGGKARLYLFYGDHRQVFSGEDGARRLIEASALGFISNRETWLRAIPAGPCRSFPCDDSWTDRPFNGGVVLVGDAAGYNDPLIGQGLSLALRDVRALSEILLNGLSWSESAFCQYGAQRAERLRRTRFVARLYARETVTFGPQGRAFRNRIRERIHTDPSLLDGLLAMFVGPDTMNPEVATEGFHRRYFGD